MNIITADNGGVSGTAGLKQSADSSGILALATGTGTTAVTIDASQNVGVGTASPSRKLEVIGSIGSTYSSANDVQIALIPNYSSTVNLINSTYNSTGSYLPLAFGTNGSERMRIDTSGNLLVGATSQISLEKVGITFNGQVSNGLVMKTTYATLGSSYALFYNSAGGLAGQISQSGTTAVTYATTSDYRLKENVLPMQNALAVVAQLKPVTYSWKIDGSAGQGFIAHELQEVVPDCVIGEKDAVDADGNAKYQGIDTSFLVATLTAAIQEQQALITQLQADVAALKGTK